MNDVVDTVDVAILLFADDLKIFIQILSLVDCVRLQVALDNLSAWCQSNRLDLNVSKCYAMTYTRKKNAIHFDYNIHGIVLSRVTEIRDLGILCDSGCSFVPHINQLILASNRTYGFIVRNTKCFQNPSTLIALYNCLIRSRLEYCNIVWRPIYDCHRKCIESVQRKFYKFLMWKQEGVYPPIGYDHKLLLSRYNADSNVDRVNICALLFIYKIVNQKIDCSELLSRLPFLVPRLGSRNEMVFYCAGGRTNANFRSPINYACRLFNSLASVCDVFHDSPRSIVQAYYSHRASLSLQNFY